MRHCERFHRVPARSREWPETGQKGLSRSRIPGFPPSPKKASNAITRANGGVPASHAFPLLERDKSLVMISLTKSRGRVSEGRKAARKAEPMNNYSHGETTITTPRDRHPPAMH